MDQLEKLIPQLISLQRQLSSSYSEDDAGTNSANLTKLLQIADMFTYSHPMMAVNTHRDGVTVSGVIPGIRSPKDIAVTLEGGIILHIYCLWHKNDKAQEYNRKVTLPFLVNPDTLTVTYQKSLLKINARKDQSGIHLRTVKTRFME